MKLRNITATTCVCFILIIFHSIFLHAEGLNPPGEYWCESYGLLVRCIKPSQDPTFATVNRFFSWNGSNETPKIIQIPKAVYTGIRDREPERFPVTEIEPKAFSDETINKYYNTIDEAFRLRFATTLEKIGDYAFYNNQYLLDVTEGDILDSYYDVSHLRIIGNYAFAHCRGIIRGLLLPRSILEIGEGSFFDSSFPYIEIEDGSHSRLNIKKRAFYQCASMTGFYFPKGRPISIGDEAFRDCSGINQEWRLPAEIDSIGNLAFAGSSFKGQLIIPDSLKFLGGVAFAYTGIQGPLEIPDKLERIPVKTFLGCRNLSGFITFGKNVKEIQPNAFMDIGDIQWIIAKPSIPPAFSSSINEDSPYFPEEIYNNATLFVPQEYIDIYSRADGWKQFSKIQALNDNVKLDSVKIFTENNINRVILPPGGSRKLAFRMFPIQDNVPVCWYSENQDIAKVSSEGVIVGKAEGKTKVWISSIDGKKDCIDVYVSKPIEKISLDQSEYELTINRPYGPPVSNYFPQFSVEPDNGLNQELIKWSVSDESVAEIVDSKDNSNRVNLKLKCYGTAILKGIAMDGSGVTVNSRLVVKYADDVTINLSEKEMSVRYGEIDRLIASVSPSYANQKVAWYSSDSHIITVDSTGTIQSIGAGEAYIYAKTTDGTEKLDSCLVKTDLGIGIDPTNPKLNIEDQLKFRLRLYENVPIKDVKWFVDEICEGYISIDQTGLATVMKYPGRPDYKGMNGCLRIGARGILNDSSVNFSREIQITNYPNRLNISNKSISIIIGDSVQLSVKKLPDGTGGDYVSWETSNANIAEVDNAGRVKAISSGEVKIFATSYSGMNRRLVYSDTCSISVNPRFVESIILQEYSGIHYVGDQFKIQATILPDNAMNQILIWSSSNNLVATVDETGLVKAIGIGHCFITASATDGSGVNASCEVTVEPILVESLSISPEEFMGTKGDSFTIVPSILPENADNKKLEYSSSNENVAEVNDSGVVNLKKDGIAVIAVKTTDGSDIEAKCIVAGTSGINSIFKDEASRCDIYDTTGILLRKDADKEYVSRLAKGVYIIVKDNQFIKLNLMKN